MKEIIYIKRKNLNVSKYDACIERSINSRIYACSWYLDIVTDHWDVLVYGDYEAVMPLPFLRLKRNLFLSHIYTPPFVQQLGIFSLEEIDTELENLFFLNFKNSKPRQYTFNSNNFSENPPKGLKKRINYELNLSETKEKLVKNYSVNLKRKLKKQTDFEIQNVTETEFFEAINFIQKNINLRISSKNFKKLKRLLTESFKRNILEIWLARIEKETHAMLVLIKDGNKWVNIMPVSSVQGKDSNAMSFLVDFIIRLYAEQPEIFDFEGSMIKGIAKFYKSFGAEKITYYFYQKPFSLF